MNKTARGVVAAVTALAVTSCSFVVVDRAPNRPPDDPAAPISCSTSNWGAGVDFTVFAISALVAGSLAGKSDNPDTELDERDDARTSALAAGGVALLTGASMASSVVNFRSSGQYGRSSMATTARPASRSPRAINACLRARETFSLIVYPFLARTSRSPPSRSS